MTSLSERLRVKYGSVDEMETREITPSKCNLKKMTDQKYKNSNRIKLFQNGTHLAMSEGPSNLTDSGIHSTVDISETALNGSFGAKNFRSPVTSPARVKSQIERQASGRSHFRNHTGNIPSTTFYARNNDINTEEAFPIFSSSSSINNRKPRDNFKLSSSGPNRLLRANVSPAASEIVTSRSKQSKHGNGSGVSLQNSLYVTGNCAKSGVLPAKMHQSVPAREASVCEGKGKCNKPVCFICMV